MLRLLPTAIFTSKISKLQVDSIYTLHGTLTTPHFSSCLGRRESVRSSRCQNLWVTTPARYRIHHCNSGNITIHYPIYCFQLLTGNNPAFLHFYRIQTSPPSEIVGFCYDLANRLLTMLMYPVNVCIVTHG